VIRKESDNSLVQAFQYGSTNARLMDTNYRFGYLKLFASTGGTTLAEYTEFTAAVPTWTKSYTYFGSSQLATITPNGSGGEYTEFNHPDRLGTRLVTNQQGGTAYEQVHFPFGTALNAESSITDNPRRFTSYDRSSSTGLDYAINRTYDSKAGRFTQVDPIGMRSVDLNTPQSLNLYNYCGNDPINRTDPDGLFWASLGRFFKKVWKGIVAAAAAVARVLNNRWVRLGFFILDFVLPGLGGLVAKIAKVALKIYTKASDIAGMVQLADMAIKGKFKELGISLVIASATAPLTALANGIKTGMQEAIFRGRGFPDLASFFKHAGIGFYKGFRAGWSQMMDGFRRKGLEAFVPFYGNYCGPGYPSGGDQGIRGINDFDNNGCRPHDSEMAFSNEPNNFRDKPGSRLWFRIKSDLKLIARAFIYGTSVHSIDVAFAGRPGLGANYKFMLVPSFLFGRVIPMNGRLIGHQIVTSVRGGH